MRMRFVVLFLTFLSLLTFTVGCDVVQEIIRDPGYDEINPWVGAWEIVSLDGLSIAETFAEGEPHAALEGYGCVWFYDDGRWDGYVEASFGEGGFNLGIYFQFIGTYTVSDNYFTLALDGDEEIFSDENGKWEIEKDTLTLQFDDGSIVILQRLSFYPERVEIGEGAEVGGAIQEATDAQ